MHRALHMHRFHFLLSYFCSVFHSPAELEDLRLVPILSNQRVTSLRTRSYCLRCAVSPPLFTRYSSNNDRVHWRLQFSRSSPTRHATTSYNGASSSNAFLPTRPPHYIRWSTAASSRRNTRERIYEIMDTSMDRKMKLRPDSLSIATLPNTYFRVLDSRHFCGEIIIEKDRGKAIETACRAHRMTSTSTNITLAIFTDGSRRGLSGAYAVTFKRYAPGTEEHGCEVAAGWPVFRQSINGCELLAIKQAIKVAISELATMERQLPPKTKSKVQVQIFNDGMFTLEHLAELRETMPKESDHISSIYRWSKRFRERFEGHNSPLRVKLQLLWVPGHIDKVKLHCKADEVAGIVSETTMPLLIVGGEERPCRHWDSMIQKLTRELPASSYQVTPRVAEVGDAEGQDGDYDLFPCQADTNGPGNNLEVLEGSNDYDTHGNDNHLQSRPDEERQDVSFEQWVYQCQDIQRWNQLAAEFQGCYQEWYTLFLKEQRKRDVNLEMGGT